MSPSIPHLLRAAVERIPGAKLRTSERVITVRELDAESRAAALRWLAAGCRPGDEVNAREDDPEPLIADYDLKSWTTPGYTGTDRMKKSMPLLKDRYRGVSRRPAPAQPAAAAPDNDKDD